eukprot:tig00000237_g20482.t1
MADVPMDPDSVAQILRSLLVPDTSVVSAAEERIKKVVKQPECVGVLLHLIQACPEPQVRQLAAVMLRKKIATHYGRIPADLQASVKTVMLESIVKEPQSLVRRAVSNVVAALAKLLVPPGQWNELLVFLHQCSQSPQKEHREAAMLLFSTLTETIGDTLRQHFETLKNVFATGLADAEASVRVAALKAVSALVQWIENEQEAGIFGQLIVPIVTVVRQCLAQGDEDTAIKAFEIFDDCVELDVAVPVPLLVELMLEVARNAQLELNTREKALNFVCWVAQFKPKVLTKNKALVQATLETLFRMAVEPEDDPSDADELTSYKVGCQTVDALAQCLPPKHVFPAVWEFSSRACASPHPAERRAGQIILGVASEGCREVMRDKLNELLPVVYAGTTDGELHVREAACIALAQFAEFLQPEIFEHHANLMPVLLGLLQDAREVVQEKTCYALDALCENMEADDILPYLGTLVEALMRLLHHGKGNVQEMAVSALASLASAAEDKFAPYYAAVQQTMSALMRLASEDKITLRARATECAGLVALSVGRAVCGGDVPGLLAATLQNMQSVDSNELRELSYGLLQNVCRLLKEDFAAYLPTVVPLAIASCESEDGIVSGPDEGDDDDDDDAPGRGIDSDDEKDDRPRSISVRTAWLDEKAAAASALGCFAECTGALFAPYVERSVKTLVDLAKYFHEDVRGSVMGSLYWMAVVVHETCPPAHPRPPEEQTVRKMPFKGGDPAAAGPSLMPTDRPKYWAKNRPETWGLSEQAAQCVAAIQGPYLEALEEDDDRDVVRTACEALGDLVHHLGPAAVQQCMERLVSALVTLLKRKAPCQVYEEEEEEGEHAHAGASAPDADERAGADESNDAEEVLTDAVCECVAGLAKGLGPAFAPFYAQLFPHIIKYSRASRSAQERVMAIGNCAEVCNFLQYACEPYVQRVAEAAVRGLRDEDEGVQRNSAYCVGVLCEHGGAAAQALVLPALQALHPLFSKPEDKAVTDNAAAAVARMILAHPATVPLPQVLPVLLAALPLKSDRDEEPVVYRALRALYDSKNPALEPCFERVLEVLGEGVASGQSSGPVRAQVADFVRAVVAQHRDAVAQMLPRLSSGQHLAPFLAGPA